MAHVGDLLVELRLPSGPVVRQVAELVLKAFEAVADYCMIGDPLLKCCQSRLGAASTARPKRSDQGTEAKPQTKGDEEGGQVHGCSMATGTDSSLGSRPRLL